MMLKSCGMRVSCSQSYATTPMEIWSLVLASRVLCDLDYCTCGRLNDIKDHYMVSEEEEA